MIADLPAEQMTELSAACGLDLASFRPAHVQARVERAVAIERVPSLAALRDKLARDERARRAFRRSIAISVTGYFRDSEQFDSLRAVLGEAPPPARPTRVWSAGCATGEEVWTVAAVLATVGRADGATVLGSDLLTENVRVARSLRPGPEDLAGARIPSSVRLRFECRDLVRQGAPGTGWDLVLCRNVAIYLCEERRRGVHRALAASLAPGGLLMLGRSERLSDPRALALARIAPHIYRRDASA